MSRNSVCSGDSLKPMALLVESWSARQAPKCRTILVGFGIAAAMRRACMNNGSGLLGVGDDQIAGYVNHRATAKAMPPTPVTRKWCRPRTDSLSSARTSALNDWTISPVLRSTAIGYFIPDAAATFLRRSSFSKLVTPFLRL